MLASTPPPQRASTLSLYFTRSAVDSSANARLTVPGAVADHRERHNWSKTPNYEPTLSELISRKRFPLRHEQQVLIGCARRIIVQTFYVTVGTPQGDVVETADGEGGLGVRGGDEAFLWEVEVFSVRS